jgi:hypothetical protein
MTDNGFAYRGVFLFFLVNAVMFGALCVVAKHTGSFHLRVLCEGFAAGYSVLLTVWVCLAHSDFLSRLLAALIGVVGVTVACRYGQGLRRGQEQPTRLRSCRCAGGVSHVQVLPCQLSGFGHVVMPVLALGNEASSARCIRPGGRDEHRVPRSEQLAGQASKGA